MTTQISFADHVAEQLQLCRDGMIMESEMARGIGKAIEGKLPYVAKPTSDYEALGLDVPNELPPVESAITKRGE